MSASPLLIMNTDTGTITLNCPDGTERTYKSKFELPKGLNGLSAGYVVIAAFLFELVDRIEELERRNNSNDQAHD